MQRYISVLSACIFLFGCDAQTLTAQDRWQEISIPMRDGQELAADVYALDNDLSIAKPVILIQTPYNKNFYRTNVGIPDQAGGATIPYDSVRYHYVIVDWRGRFASSDAADPDAEGGIDGYDCVEWIAAQPWCSGRVGTWGPSALGQRQFETAREHPPHLVCAVPIVRDYKTEYEDFYYGGVFRQEHIGVLQLLGFLTVDLILSAPEKNNIWRFTEMQTDYPADIEVPMLLIGGWFDHFPDGVIRAFHDLRRESAPTVRNDHKLIYGPWTHSGFTTSGRGAVTYPDVEGVSHAAALRFFAHYLLDEENDWESEPVMRYYQLGANEWRTTDDWYALAQAEDTLYLHPSGALTDDPANAGAVSTSFDYDPRDPSPSVGGARFTPLNPLTPIGPQDQAPVESRPDALVFSTPVLSDDLTINGAVRVELFVTSDREDTDFSIRLCDVQPDGTSLILTDGIRRMRFRENFEEQILMTPGVTYPVVIELQHLAATFRVGHQLRIIVSSSDYPRFDINLNNGGPMYEAGDTLIAHNTVFHNVEYPSRVILPVATPTSVRTVKNSSPQELQLLDIRPNPAGDECALRFSTASRATVEVVIVDNLGRERSVHKGGEFDAGSHTLNFDVGGMANGSYRIVLRAEDGIVSAPLRVMR